MFNTACRSMARFSAAFLVRALGVQWGLTPLQFTAIQGTQGVASLAFVRQKAAAIRRCEIVDGRITTVGFDAWQESRDRDFPAETLLNRKRDSMSSGKKKRTRLDKMPLRNQKNCYRARHDLSRLDAVMLYCCIAKTLPAH